MNSQVLVDKNTGMKPQILSRLADWQYLERSTHRLLAAWTGYQPDWDAKSAMHRHIWEQAEIVRRLRDRITQFPAGRVDEPAPASWETLANAVLLAPGLEDAMDGIYQILNVELVRQYSAYVQSVHPVHDAPTIQLLGEIVALKEAQRLWWRDYRRQHPHQTNPQYRERIERQLAQPMKNGGTAAPVGVNTTFRLLEHGARPASTAPKHDIRPYIDREFSTSVEARRLFWAYGYLLEMNLPDEQLHWIWNAHYMPWEFHHDISRHLWDESRHGNSGRSRLLDFGITVDEIGYPTYGGIPGPMSAKDVYEAVFFIGMVAETGHFKVKQEAYQDFRDGGDYESAEMMLFDIIDESTHVQYAHRWLPVLAQHAGIDGSGYKERAEDERARRQAEYLQRLATFQPDLSSPDYKFYQDLLTRIRRVKPLTNATSCPPRSQLPM